MTVYVTPKSKGSEKYAKQVVAEFVTVLLEVTENQLLLRVRVVVVSEAQPRSTVAPKLCVDTANEQFPTCCDTLTNTLRETAMGSILLVEGVMELAIIVLLEAVQRQSSVENSPLPVSEHGELPEIMVNSLGNMMLMVPLDVIWLTVEKENRQRVRMVPISAFRHETVTLSEPAAAEYAQFCTIREQFPAVPRVRVRVQVRVLKGIVMPAMAKINLAFSAGCEEIELISKLLSNLVNVIVPKPEMETVFATALSPKAGGKTMVSVSEGQSGVERLRSNITVVDLCTISLEMSMLVKLLGCMPLMVMLHESIPPIVPRLVCVQMLIKLLQGFVEGGMRSVIVNAVVNAV